MTGLLTGVSVLMIGASQFAHDGYLISTLHDDLQRQGATVESFGACATVPDAWLKPKVIQCGTATRLGSGPVVENRSSTAIGWSVTELIHQYHPKLVVIGIADTLAGYRQPELSTDWVRQQVHGLVERITAEHVACVWLGTTWGTEGGPLGKNYARVKQLSDALAEDVAPCSYVDSLQFSKPGEWATIDGQHHTAAAYVMWGQFAGKAIVESDAVKSLVAAVKK